MKIVAIIPARSGSKGLPDKNIKILGKKPLIVRTVEQASKSKLIEKIIFSSDSEKYYESVKAFNQNIIFHKRTSELAEDVPTEWVVLDVIEKMPSFFDEDSIIAILQPTTPFITHEDFDSSIKKLIDNPDMNCCISVKAVSEHPEWMITQQEGDIGICNEITKELSVRQNLPKRWIPNGGIYAVRINFLKNERKVFGKKILVHEMNKIKSMDIDENEDFIICDSLVKSKFIE